EGEDYIAELMVESNVTLDTNTILSILNLTEMNGTTVTVANTDLIAGMVTIDAPDGIVCYESSPTLKCTSPEETTGAAWFMNKQFERFQLNTGSVVKLNTSCTTEEDKSCIAVTLEKNFLKGLGATQEVAMDIFQGLKNSSTAKSESSDATADISASINVLNVMASASENVDLNDDVFPDFVNAASNMLNNTWTGVNQSTVHTMSSSYLQSVEGLVKNIKVNRSRGLDSDNLDLKFCTSSDCNVTVFDVGVNVNKTAGMVKTGLFLLITGCLAEQRVSLLFYQWSGDISYTTILCNS
ncbi:hypothetical protein GBF38_005745, partial [Nibea albiflora]